jgi:hypothetical protein
VKQAIEKIMDFVITTVHPKNTDKLDLSTNGLTALLDFAASNTESIKKSLVNILFNHRNQSEIEASVQNCQALIIRLLNDLSIYQQNLDENNTLLNLYRSLSNLLVDVLTYIERYFSRYFNVDEEIPQIYYLLNNEDFDQQLSSLNLDFKDRISDPQLLDMIIDHNPMQANNRNSKTVTFRDLIYWKELLEELNDMVSRRSNYKSVEEILLYFNFNHIQFFKYLIDKLQEEYDKLEAVDAKLELLKYRRKFFRQINIKPNFVLFSQFPSIKEQALNWIEEEIYFIKSLQHQDEILEKKDIEPTSQSKISVALSVAQLAFLIRVFILGKIITNHNQSDVIRIFASNFKTYKTEDISYGSLYGKYFKPEASAIKEVKGALLQLVTLITKMKE